MKIQPINIMRRPKPCFTQSERRTNIDKGVTVADLYEMEDRINARLDMQDEAIAKGLWYIADSLTFDNSDNTPKEAAKRLQLHSNVCDSLVKLNSMNDINSIRFEDM